MLLTLALLASSPMISAAEDVPPPRVLADFEGDDYGGWVAEGDAFGTVPARGTLPGQQAVSGFLGEGLVNSFRNGDGATGTLTSPEFVVDRPWLNLLIGGGKHPEGLRAELLVDGKPAREATGNATTGGDDEHLSWVSWDVADLKGKKARVRIVDRETGSWGHINVDQVELSDARRASGAPDDRLARARDSVKGAAARAAADPARPVWHFRPPALWMNDPNGPFFLDGEYHLFYQHNPFGDRWEHMHWGHAKSKDLVHWEVLPIALSPALEKGEKHCFSGCAAIREDGTPVLFYTSIGDRQPECWMALPADKSLIDWKRHEGNPVLTATSQGTKYDEWRDPFVVRHGGKAYMVHGGNTNGTKGGEAVVSLYEAEDASLAKWKHRGILFKHPDADAVNIECPLFFPVGEKWVLIVSPHRPAEWFAGTFDPEAGRFTAEKRGKVDASFDYYAPNTLETPDGRRVMWSWVRNFPGGKGWNGVLGAPRVLSIGSDGGLVQRPAEELKSLRGNAIAKFSGPVPPSGQADPRAVASAPQLEAKVTFTPGDAKAFGIKIGETRIRCDGKSLDVAGVITPLPEDVVGKPLELTVYLDRSLLEVFDGTGRIAATKVIPYAEPGHRLELFSEGGEARADLQAWALKPIW